MMNDDAIHIAPKIGTASKIGTAVAFHFIPTGKMANGTEINGHNLFLVYDKDGNMLGLTCKVDDTHYIIPLISPPEGATSMAWEGPYLPGEDSGK